MPYLCSQFYVDNVDYIQKKRGKTLLFSFEYNLLPKLIHTLLCEVTINFIGKCFVVFFHPHFRIKSKASAYMSRHLHIKSKKKMPLLQALVLDVICKCLQIYRHLFQILYAYAGGKKPKHLPIECLQGTIIIIYSVPT